MLFPAAPSGKTDESVTVSYQWGHPFEHELFDAPPPVQVFVVAPDGHREDLSANLKKVSIKGKGDRSAAGYEFSFAPKQRGDHQVILSTPPIWMNDEKLFLQDSVKTVFHVQTQNGWDSLSKLPFEIAPLTRPYGLIPGTAFQGQLFVDGRAFSGAIVEIERYNSKPPAQLPRDEQITRAVKSDPNGVFTATLSESGWWSATAATDGGQREHEGKMYPVTRRATIWVYVDEKQRK